MLHERSPLFVGPAYMVEKAEQMMQEHSPEFNIG
jgi:fructose-1,6-bisphosphatase